MAKLYAITEAAADRAQMHAIIGEQRNNWNQLLLHSINSMTLAASISAGISLLPSVIQSSPPLHLAFKLSSVFLLAASTAMMAITSKIQPSQLAEEQRNAARLFGQLEKSIHTRIALQNFAGADVREAMERVLAIDKAYPLPLLPGMLEKFPETVEPAVWWPTTTKSSRRMGSSAKNGWSNRLEKEMEGIVDKVWSNDMKQYVDFGNLVLRVNKVLAVLGPVLAGLATVGASLAGVGAVGPWPGFVGLAAGAMATVVNTLQHGGQAGMLVELSRNCAGFYKELKEKIEEELRECNEEKREDGELFEMKVALRLGRGVSELKGFAAKDEAIGEFAGKLF